MDFVKVSNENRIAEVRIDRPKALNALSLQVFRELDEAFAALRHDDTVGALIVTGAGEKAFVAGADIKELATLDSAGAKQVSESGQAFFRKVENFPKPVIAAVNGFALGGGCELALACHIRIAATNAKFGLPEVSLGLIPGYAGTQRLPRLVGRGLAFELLLTGDMIDAARALQIGLANQVVEPAELMNTARKMAEKILSRGPLALRYAIEAVQGGLDMPQELGERMEANLFGLLAGSADMKEGVSAFIEKRPPVFTGK